MAVPGGAPRAPYMDERVRRVKHGARLDAHCEAAVQISAAAKASIPKDVKARLSLVQAAPSFIEPEKLAGRLADNEDAACVEEAARRTRGTSTSTRTASSSPPSFTNLNPSELLIFILFNLYSQSMT